MRRRFPSSNLCIAAGVKVISRRKRGFRLFSNTNLAFRCVEDSASADNGHFSDTKCDSSEFTEEGDFSCGGIGIRDSFDEGVLNFEKESVNSDKFKSMVSAFSNSVWCGDSKVGMDPVSIDRMLDNLFRESQDASLVLEFFRWVENCTGSKHALQSACRMINILVSQKMNHRAVELIREIVRKNGVEEDFNDIFLNVLCEIVTDKKVFQTICSILVDCCVEENMVDMALKFTYQMRDIDVFPSKGVYNSLLRALLGSEQLDLAWDLFEEMLSNGTGSDVSFFSLFIKEYSDKGNIESGWKMLTEMKKHGIQPDIVAYTIIIDSLCKLSYPKLATCLLFKVAQLGISPDSVSVSSVVDGYCKVGGLEEAFNLLKSFNLPLNLFICNSVISNLCADGNMAQASKTFHTMSELGMQPDLFVYTNMIKGYCKVKDLSRAFQFLGKMFKCGIKPSVTTYTLLIDSYCKSGDIGMAENLFQRMILEGLQPDIVAHNALMDGYGKKGQLHKAFELLNMMTSASINPDVVTYNILIHSLAARGFVDEAKDIIDELITRGLKPDVMAFTNVIDGYSGRGKFEEAYLVWFYMSECDTKPDVVTCSALLNGYCRARRIDEAKALFNKFLEIGLSPDLIFYNTLIHGYCSVGKINEACELVSMMVGNGILPNIVTHRAFVLGFEKKWADNPAEYATFKLQEILLQQGVEVNLGEYLAGAQESKC